MIIYLCMHKNIYAIFISLTLYFSALVACTFTRISIVLGIVALAQWTTHYMSTVTMHLYWFNQTNVIFSHILSYTYQQLCHYILYILAFSNSILPFFISAFSFLLTLCALILLMQFKCLLLSLAVSCMLAHTLYIYMYVFVNIYIYMFFKRLAASRQQVAVSSQPHIVFVLYSCECVCFFFIYFFILFCNVYARKVVLIFKSCSSTPLTYVWTRTYIHYIIWV